MARSATDEPDVRERLIQGTFDVLANDGTEGLTVRRIAEAAGRSTMCVYSKFGNRRRLLQEVYHRAAAALSDALARAKPADGALGVALAYRRFARSHPERYALLFEHPLGPLELPPAVRQDAIRQVADALTDAGGGQSYATWATMHGLVVLERTWSPGRRVPWTGSGWEDHYTAQVASAL
jgi:AcrR family transcriptional regulator